jgi:hypothetical protein
MHARVRHAFLDSVIARFVNRPIVAERVQRGATHESLGVSMARILEMLTLAVRNSYLTTRKAIHLQLLWTKMSIMLL